MNGTSICGEVDFFFFNNYIAFMFVRGMGINQLHVLGLAGFGNKIEQKQRLVLFFSSVYASTSGQKGLVCGDFYMFLIFCHNVDFSGLTKGTQMPYSYT